MNDTQDAARDNAELLQEVERFLRRNRSDYERFLGEVLRELGIFRDVRKRSAAIYRIYNRGDKQTGGEILKSNLSIVKKLRKWRENNPKVRINEIHDIVGVTVVTYFESEIETVSHALKKTCSDVFEVESVRQIEGDEYNATHIVVKRPSARKLYGGPLCEIQIKSLIHDGWATRTHDLVYKARKGEDSRIDKQVEALGRLVRTLEQQSDVLRAYLLGADIDDDSRREAAALSLFFQLTQSGESEAEKEVAKISQALLKDREYFTSCAEDDPALVRLFHSWKNIHAKVGESRPVCRFIVLLALIRGGSDYENDAIETIDTWIDSAPDGQGKAGAMSFKALALWALGDLFEAISAARDAVSYSESKGLDTVTGRTNLAYYLAEEFFRSGSKSKEDRNAIQDLISAAAEVEDLRRRMSLLDSRGAVQIMIGETAPEIYEGVSMCEEAQKWSASSTPDKTVFQLFFELHERRARRRLQELT